MSMTSLFSAYMANTNLKRFMYVNSLSLKQNS